VTRLGEFVLGRVCASARRYPWLRISVNVSPLQLLSDDFVGRTMAIIRAHQVSPNQIEFELTESIAIKDLEAARRQLETLQLLGFTTALDDFGTGFSSIGYLRWMPFDSLKIDRSFVSGRTLQEIENVVRPIVLLGHSLGKSVTAEGVESILEADCLRQTGCDHLQGYAFGYPQPIEDVVSAYPVRVPAAAE
jgi:EAL domain-containing protein (putative c-di-GMP-specific phosphodiesterase class I)